MCVVSCVWWWCCVWCGVCGGDVVCVTVCVVCGDGVVYDGRRVVWWQVDLPTKYLTFLRQLAIIETINMYIIPANQCKRVEPTEEVLNIESCLTAVV